MDPLRASRTRSTLGQVYQMRGAATSGPSRVYCRGGAWDSNPFEVRLQNFLTLDERTADDD